MSGFASLEEALARGRGRERPFRCPVHGDRHASASVNVIKGWWYCYVCGAKGTTAETIEAPDFEFGNALVELLDSDAPPVYPESWLDQFDRQVPAYWRARFDEATCRHFRLGFDAWRSVRGEHRPSPCYPLRDPGGRVCGVVYRQLEHEPKYVYPTGVRVTDLLFGYSPQRREAITLVEGAADAMAAWEVGHTAWALYGAQISAAQITLLHRAGVRRAYLAMDNDKAGQRAIYGYWTEHGRWSPGLVDKLDEAGIETFPLDWEDSPAKDLGELDVATRRELLIPLHT